MARLLEDFLTLDELAAEVKRHPRSVRRWLDEPDPPPFTKYGNEIVFHIPSIKQWLLDRTRNPRKPRKKTK